MPVTSSSQSIYNPRRHVEIHPEHVSNVSSTDYPGHYPDEDHSWNLENFKNVCFITIVEAVPVDCSHIVYCDRICGSRFNDCRNGP
jgi:hypothetical protein